jgi:hypothetical protein
MAKIKLNYFVDVGMGLTFVLAAITGIIKWPRLLPWLGISYLKLPMNAITFIHDWSGIIMALLVLIHTILHWKWLVAVTKNLFRKKDNSKKEDVE